MKREMVARWLAAGRVVRRLSGGEGSIRLYGLFTSENPLAIPKASVPFEMVSDLLASGAAREVDGNVVLTEEGRTRLMRAKDRSGNPFRASRIEMGRRAIDGEETPLAVNTRESPLGWLYARRNRDGTPILSRSQFEAGMRLNADFVRSGFAGPVGVQFDQPGASGTRKSGGRGPTEFTDGTLDARARYRAALDGLEPDMERIAVAVCCHEKPLTEAEAALGWPRRSAKLVLGIALSVLARHYGLVLEPRSERRAQAAAIVRS